MLSIFKDLFSELENAKIFYCVYKGLDHLEEDLDGLRGDVDILVSPDSVSDVKRLLDERNSGFRRVKRLKPFPMYYVGRDPGTGRFVMLDIDVSIGFGRKPIAPIRFTPEWEDLRITQAFGINVLDEQEADALTELLLRSRSRELEAEGEGFGDGLFGSALNSIGKGDAEDWIRDNFLGGKFLAYAKSFFYTSFYWLERLFHLMGRLALGAAYRVRKRGLLIAFVGVDGAGKTSAVEAVMTDKYYRATGVKGIYFGNNEYWIPGALALNRAFNSVPILKQLARVLLSVDRQLRLLYALFLKWRGNVVVCDRYYYDDDISRLIIRREERGRRSIKSYIRLLGGYFKPAMLVNPDLTVYLNVSPEVAFSRKQDFSFEVMLEMNAIYKKAMAEYEEVVFVDADEDQETVCRKVFSLISNLDD